ncbi:hypothetical protein ELH96_19775 [Rhizobium leguminosarum]|nr:hypothetical protein [Rhizobium leguminosarum]TAY13853.1 hypothetical protein ELH96_19775 [Rhizobium leguminosarum]
MLAEQKNFKTQFNATHVDEALSWHDGDARATIETLLLDCQFLREQLRMANSCISRGLTRGWVGSLERGTSQA